MTIDITTSGLIVSTGDTSNFTIIVECDVEGDDKVSVDNTT